MTADEPPELLRGRLVALAAEALGGLPAEEVPPTLRRVARFTPRKRASAGGPIAAALATPAFRAAVAVWLAGQPAAAPDAEPRERAAVLWLSRPVGWEEQLAELLDRLATDDDAAAQDDAALRAAREQAEAERARLRREVRRLEDRLAAAERDRDARRRELDRAVRRAERAEAELGAARAEHAAAQETARRRLTDGEAEARRLRNRLADAEQELAAERGASRRARAEDDLRTALLLDTVVAAATALRRELALPPPPARPGDAVAPTTAPSGRGPAPGQAPPVRARAADDPAWLEELLRLPNAHLVVDGYNVTKTGYGGLTLEQQRERLLAGLAALRVRLGAEVTVVFDGLRATAGVGAGAARGVRVRFSAEGETADVLIARFVRAEPPGRPLVVVSSDREVADSARSAGAYSVPSPGLLRLLG